MRKLLALFCCISVTLLSANEPSPSKVAFITGGATGIGAATIKKFVEQNIKVGFLDINHDKGVALASTLSPDDVIFIEGDVSCVADIRNGIEQTVKKFGQLDIVFANAGIHQLKTLLEMSEHDWKKMMDVNVKGVVFTVKEALPYLIQQGGGSVIITGSDQALVGKRSNCAYGMSKGAVVQFAKSAALDFGAQNIRVNAICPATIRTPLAEAAFNQWAKNSNTADVEDLWNREAESYPLKRYGTSEEVANLVYFLASDDASFITGSVYSIDGGFTAQ